MKYNNIQIKICEKRIACEHIIFLRHLNCTQHKKTETFFFHFLPSPIFYLFVLCYFSCLNKYVYKLCCLVLGVCFFFLHFHILFFIRFHFVVRVQREESQKDLFSGAPFRFIQKDSNDVRTVEHHKYKFKTFSFMLCLFI